MHAIKTIPAAPLLLASSLCCISTSVLAAPANGNITLGDGSITQNGATTSITQNSDRLSIDWASFNIADGEQVNFSQPDARAIALNRDFSGSPSEIFGDLTANGQVFLLNTAGILVSSTGAIDTAGLLLSDRQLTEGDLLGNRLTLSAPNQPSTTGIENLGTITAGAGGAHFVSGRMVNRGSVETADGGDISFTFAGTSSVTLDGSNLVNVASAGPLASLEGPDNILFNNAESTSTIVSMGGNIYITASYYNHLNPTITRNEGTVNAIAVNSEGGRIFLSYEPVDSPPVQQLRDQVLSEQDQQPGEESSGPADFTSGGLGAAVTLDDLVSGCTPADEANGADCEKEEAIKRYLGRMLINGRLPQ